MYQNSEKSVKKEQNYECDKIVKNYEDAYNMIDGLLYLPGQIPMRSFDHEPLLEETKNWNKVSRFIMKLPLVHRPLLLSSKETRKKLLGLDESTPILLICFGSWAPLAKEVLFIYCVNCF